MQLNERHAVIRLEGELTLASAAGLKQRLLEWVASGQDLELDMEKVEQIDVTLLQLLVAAAREAAHQGTGITVRASTAAESAARDAGFDAFAALLEQH